MTSKRELWERMKQEWPDLAEFLTELNEAGMKPEDVKVIEWPDDG